MRLAVALEVAPRGCARVRPEGPPPRSRRPPPDFGLPLNAARADEHTRGMDAAAHPGGSGRRRCRCRGLGRGGRGRWTGRRGGVRARTAVMGRAASRALPARRLALLCTPAGVFWSVCWCGSGGQPERAGSACTMRKPMCVFQQSACPPDRQQVWQDIVRHRDRLLALTRKRLPTRQDAEDCVQEAMIRTAACPGLDLARVGPFLTTVALRQVTDFYRAQHRQQTLVRRAQSVLPPVFPEDDVCDAAFGHWLLERVHILAPVRATSCSPARKACRWPRTPHGRASPPRLPKGPTHAAVPGCGHWRSGRLHGEHRCVRRRVGHENGCWGSCTGAVCRGRCVR